MLKRLGLTPLSPTLDSSLDQLDAATMEKGGLCETLPLVLKLGGMCEGQRDVIERMSDALDQFVGRETEQVQVNAEREAILQQMDLELDKAKVKPPPP